MTIYPSIYSSAYRCLSVDILARFEVGFLKMNDELPEGGGWLSWIENVSEAI